MREVELMTPRWAEEPSTVLQMVRNYLKPGAAPERRLDPHGLRLATLDELHQALGTPWRRRLVDRLLERVRYYVTVRENTRHHHTKAFAAVRARLKDWEQLLLEDGRLRCADDVFFLSWPELAALKAGAIDWPDVEKPIRERRRGYLGRLDSKPAEAFNFSGPAEEQLTAAPDDASCTGDCASPGVAEGLARVILDPAADVNLEPGEILVAPYTDPAWTPLFPGAAAVIVEVGSYLSHAGTVAREYQIPCLVDVSGCTERLKTGQKLRVNADEGWVRVLEEPIHA
jgi:pyruvate,water dikinase